MDSRKQFEEWWKILKPAEVDELKEIFEECWKAGRASMRDEAADRIYKGPTWQAHHEAAAIINGIQP